MSRTTTSSAGREFLMLVMMTSFCPLNPKDKKLERSIGTSLRMSRVRGYFFRELSDARKRDALLPLVLAAAVAVRGLAHLVGFEKDHLRHAFVGVHARRQRRGVGELQRHVPLPLRL